MKRSLMTKILAALIASVLVLTGLPAISTVRAAEAPEGATVSVGTSRVTVTINKVGTSGTASLFRMAANEYYSGDKLNGYSTLTNRTGTFIGSYVCGTSKEFTFNRFNSDGTDNLYAKYYLVQGNDILVGPFYASEVESYRSIPRFEAITKKGLTHETNETYALADEMGISNTVVNLDLGSLIYRNEDDNGNPVDNTKLTNIITFESNGELFYMDANFIKSIDGEVSEYTRRGINVTFVVITWAATNFNRYPKSLTYTTSNSQTVAFNTSNERGLKYWIAAMEFLADRYSKSSSIGYVNKYIIGNEIDYTYDWYLITPKKDENGNYNRAPFDIFMEEFCRAFRMANYAVKKYNSEAKVVVSLTHNWADARWNTFVPAKKNNSVYYNSYSPKEILDWLSTVEKPRGDFDWAVSVHPYPIGTTTTRPNITDFNTSGVKPITGDWKTSPWITCSNLELYQQYFEQPENKYNGQLREVVLTETSIVNQKKESISAEEYELDLKRQAATIAMYYYRAASLDCITEIAYFEPHDQGTYRLGLMEENGTKKPSFDLWKYIDTNISFNYSNKYLKTIADVESYKDLMPLTNSGFDWDKAWSPEKLMPRTLESSTAERSLKTSKTSYAADEAILVTAAGGEGDQVGLYKATDDLATAEPIYYYPLNTTANGILYKSGEQYDLLAYSTVNAARMSDAYLKAGNYKVGLRRSDTGEVLSADITLTGNYSIGSETPVLFTDKDEYTVGENIIVTAGGGSDYWVGLYKTTDNPGSVTSIYWYWVNDPANQRLSGKPTILQTTTHNSDSSNASTLIGSGDYKVILFNSTGYTVATSTTIKVTGSAASNLAPLKSVKYVLDNEKDGYANGKVTIVKDKSNELATDCMMFWADANGTPLEGYTSLAKFKLTGETTVHEMYTHTIIPEGAKKLIAYAYNFASGARSESYVSCDLPSGSDYRETGTILAEFQVVSDIHITDGVSDGAEVRLSNEHFKMMLRDVNTVSPKSLGIFVSGDNANNGAEQEYKNIVTMFNDVKFEEGCKNLPYIHLSIGNHDWYSGNPGKQFERYTYQLNPTLPGVPEHVYYSEEINGYKFVYLGGESRHDGLTAYQTKEQFQWLDETLAEYTAKEPDKPIFMLLHQAFYNTVAGSLPGQSWDGISDEGSLRAVLQKYPNIIFLNGHSHWELNSIRTMYPGDEAVPVAFIDGSVGYLWSSYNTTSGEFLDGSQGWYVYVYEDKVVFKGREFEQNKWIPSAYYVLKKNEPLVEDTYTVSMDSAQSLGANAPKGETYNYLTLDNSILSVMQDGTIVPKQPGTAKVVVTAFPTETAVMGKKVVTINVVDKGVTRIYGSTRYKTSLAAAAEFKAVLGVDKFDAVILSTGENFADALGGGYLAAKKMAPILLTKKTSKMSEAKAANKFISENLREGGIIYVLGGQTAVPDACLDGIDQTKFKVMRLQGTTRYDTNLAILKEAGVNAGEDVLVCTGTNFADSLAASSTGKAMLLVGKSLTKKQKTFLEGLNKKSSLTILGGTGAVSAALEKELGDYGTVTRLAGSSRYATMAMIASSAYDKANSAVLVYAENFPDGLCAGPLAYYTNAPILLVKSGKESEARKYCTARKITSGYVLGGPTLIPEASVKKIFNLQ